MRAPPTGAAPETVLEAAPEIAPDTVEVCEIAPEIAPEIALRREIAPEITRSSCELSAAHTTGPPWPART